MLRLPFRLGLKLEIDGENGEGEGDLPLLRKVRHSFPAIPPTSFITIVDAPLVTVPATAAVPAVAPAAPVTAAAFPFAFFPFARCGAADTEA